MNRSVGWLRIVCVGVLFAAICVLFWSSQPERAVTLNTLSLGLAVSAVAIPLGCLIASVCLTNGLVPRILWLACLGLIFVPLFMHVSAWDSAFGKLGWLTNITRYSTAISSWMPAVWIHAVAAAPQVALIIWFAVSNNDRTYEEQAELDTDRNTVFWRITVPRMLPLVAICLTWIIVSCAREIAVTDIYRIGTFAEQIYLGYSLGDFDQPDGKTAIIPLDKLSLSAISFGLGICALVLLTTLACFNRVMSSEKVTGRARVAVSFWQSASGILLILVLIVVPSVNLLARASKFTEITDGTPIAYYSLSNLVAVISRVPSEFVGEFQWSVMIAFVSGLVSLGLAIGLVWRALDSRIWKLLLMISIAVSCSLPGPFIGSTLLQARGLLDTTITNWLFDRTIFAPVLANVIFCWPISCVLVWFVIRNTATDALENAKLEGVSSRARLFWIVLAGNKLACAGFWLILCAICFGELSASQLAIPPGIDTIPRRMLGMLHSGVNDFTAGLTIVSVAFIIVACGLGWALVRLNQRSLR